MFDVQVISKKSGERVATYARVSRQKANAFEDRYAENENVYTVVIPTEHEEV